MIKELRKISKHTHTHTHTYIYIRLNITDIFCLHIFLLILSSCRIYLVIFDVN